MLNLNDAAEVDYPLQVIAQVARRIIEEPFIEAFLTQLREYTFRMYTPYVACFCQNGDLLSQWRAYGGRGEGFAIKFSGEWLLSLENFHLQRIIYRSDTQENIVSTALTKAFTALADQELSEDEEREFWKRVAMCLMPLIIRFKHPQFKEEDEWRLVNAHHVPPDRVRYRPAGRRIVPYIEIPISDDMAVTGLVRGPHYRGAPARSVHLLLSHFAMARSGICDSEIALQG